MLSPVRFVIKFEALPNYITDSHFLLEIHFNYIRSYARGKKFYDSQVVIDAQFTQPCSTDYIIIVLVNHYYLFTAIMLYTSCHAESCLCKLISGTCISINICKKKNNLDIKISKEAYIC